MAQGDHNQDVQAFMDVEKEFYRLFGKVAGVQVANWRPAMVTGRQRGVI
jgi:hypothetical protein